MRHLFPLLAAIGGLVASSPGLLPAQIPPPVDASVRPSGLRALRDEILAKEQAGLRALGDRLDDPAKDGSSRFVVLKEVVKGRTDGLKSVGVARNPPPKAGPAGRESIRIEASNALFDLATRSSQPPESFALADECLRGVLERQPDHAEARRLLGFVPYKEGWATPFAARMLAEGSVYEATYGWVKADWVPHLQQGELPDKTLKRWLPAFEADALRRDWASRWEITTEHFRISTNVPLRQAISFGRKLEDLHQLFFSLMADVIEPDRLPLAQRIRKPGSKPTATTSKNPYQVYYFATRDEYSDYVTPLLGRGAKTSLGTYFPKKEAPPPYGGYGGISYFFDDAGGQLDITSTLYHEASHQLLFESAGVTDYLRNAGQYWVFEGLGTYFETIQHQPDGSLRVGGFVGPRMEQARRRLVEGGEFVPIERFVALNRARFQGDKGEGDIYLNYAESMALAVFLMQADGERHREGFLDYVRDVYKGRYRGNSGRSLEDQLGTPYPELNRRFLTHLARGVAR